MKMQREITLDEVLQMGVSTFSKKDNSPRGCCTVSVNQIKPGDKILIDNYFTLVTE